MKSTSYSKLEGIELAEGSNSDVDANWAAEIERRISEVESGEAETSSWEETLIRIRAKLAKLRQRFHES